MMRIVATLVFALLLASPAHAQLGQLAGKALQGKNQIDKISDVIITEQEEIALGAGISEKLRQKYGVVQNQAVHKYVSLAGRVLAASSSRPSLPWTFIVLDTDGVNAFAAPGGYIHMTRGALALMQNEAELAGVLAHEIAHVTEKHTVNAIRNSKAVGAVGSMSRSQVLEKLVDVGYSTVLENQFDREQEHKSDDLALRMANSAGYAPAGLSGFVAKLSERNKGLKEPSGMFASHPALRTRLDRMKQQIASQKLTAASTVAARYTSTITYKPVPVTSIALVAAPGAPGEKPAPEKPGGSRFGLGGLTSKLGGEKSSDQTIASAGSRGLNPDRDAKGGSNPRAVSVTITAAEIDAFRKGIAG